MDAVEAVVRAWEGRKQESTQKLFVNDKVDVPGSSMRTQRTDKACVAGAECMSSAPIFKPFLTHCDWRSSVMKDKAKERNLSSKVSLSYLKKV